MKRVISIAKREIKLFFSNKIMLTLYLGGPVLYGLLFGAVYTSGRLTNLSIIVVDQDRSPLSKKLVDMLDENEMLQVKYVQPDNVDLRQFFIEQNIYAAVIIPDRFEKDVLQRRYTEINSYINNSNLLASSYVNRSVNLVVGTLNAVTAAKMGKPGEPVRLNTFRLFNPASNYLMFIWPSYLAIILQSVVLVVIAMSFASETENGTFRELSRPKTSLFSIVAGKLAIYWLLAAVVFLIFAGYFYLFKQRLPANIAGTMLISVLFIASLSFQGMIAGLVFNSQLKVIQFLMILTMPAYIASGFSWPFDHDAWPAQLYGILFPYMPFVNGFRVLLIEHGSPADISGYILLQVIQLLLYLFLSVLLLRIKIQKHRRLSI